MERSGILAEFFADGPALLLTALVFLATAVLTFSIMLGLRARAAIKRRAAGIAEYSGDMEDARSLGASGLKAVQRLLDYVTKHYGVSEKDKGEMKLLRRRMIQAGIFDARAAAYFFLARAALAATCFCRWSWRSACQCSGSRWSWGQSRAMSPPACISTGAWPGGAMSTAPAFPISWISWSCARIPA